MRSVPLQSTLGPTDIFHLKNNSEFRLKIRIRRKVEEILQTGQYVRVVKEADSKSAGVTRTGSNPVADVFLYLTVSILIFK